MIDGAKIVHILVSLPEAQLYSESGSFPHWVSAPDDKGQRHSVDHVNLDSVVEPALRLGYLMSREGRLERPGYEPAAVTVYELTDKGLRFSANRRAGRADGGHPRVGEYFFIITHRRGKTAEPHLYLGADPPDVRGAVGHAWRGGDSVEITGPYELGRLRLTKLDELSEDGYTIGRLEAAPT